ncbi:helix-turn-helix transcriptional regulator [Streptomyces sp. NBC_00726]|uniref:helix-turn-helix transcriptional regulator n=1 Tax=Streptomyces sp. NBC_00726 TaxID=2903674 RepID=UPI00386BC39C
MLSRLGFESHEEDVYRLILENHGLRPSDVRQRLNLTEEQVRRAVDQLIDRKLLAVPFQDELRPVDPNLSLYSLLSDQLSELHDRQKEYERTRADIRAMLAEFGHLYPSRSQPDAERLIGMDSVQERMQDLADAARQECMTFNPGGGQSAASLAASKPLDSDVIARGVRMRTVYLDSVRNDPTTVEYAGWLTGLGGQVRTVPVLPIRMAVIDRAVAILPMDPDHTRKGAVQINSPGVVKALTELFERVWADAVPLGDGHDRCEELDEHGLARREQELLRLLAQGLTDAAASKSLGVSLRTVRRMTADLSERLNARSRFEAGLRAGQRGWL